MEREPRKLPSGMVDTESYITEEGRDEIDLGENFDESHTILPPYVEIDGVQYHPDRLPE